jgi:hypothetical protein
MKKNKLLFIPFLASLALIFYSWYLTYPLALNSVSDVIPNHVPILYWISLPILFISIFMMATSFKNEYFKWILTVVFVIVLYSLFYFFYTLPTSDTIWFTSLTENFIRTNNLNATQFIHSYYQWPSFFLLGDIVTTVSGLGVISYEFLLFTIIGFLIATGLYVYASKMYSRGGFLAVAAYFIIMFYFLNYQAVPFSLAFALLILLFMLETQKKNTGSILTTLILFASTVITHAFFVIYLLIRSIIGRSKQYLELFILTVVIYLLVQINFAGYSFAAGVFRTMILPTEYNSITGATFTPASVPTDIIPQLFSRTVTVAFAILCIAGFVFLIFRRKLKVTDKAIFITGVLYSVLGVALYILGSRAIAIVFVPVSLGILYLFESKFRPHLKYLVVVLLIFFVFVPIHFAYATGFPTDFQTKDDLASAHFMMEKYDWTTKSVVIADLGASIYIPPQINGNTQIDSDIAPRFNLANITLYDSIVYSVGLASSLQRSNIPIEQTSQQITDRFDVVYNSGFSYIATKSR